MFSKHLKHGLQRPAHAQLPLLALAHAPLQPGVALAVREINLRTHGRVVVVVVGWLLYLKEGKSIEFGLVKKTLYRGMQCWKRLLVGEHTADYTLVSPKPTVWRSMSGIVAGRRPFLLFCVEANQGAGRGWAAFNGRFFFQQRKCWTLNGIGTAEYYLSWACTGSNVRGITGGKISGSWSLSGVHKSIQVHYHHHIPSQETCKPPEMYEVTSARGELRKCKMPGWLIHSLD